MNPLPRAAPSKTPSSAGPQGEKSGQMKNTQQKGVEEEERRKKKGGRREKVEVVRVEEGGEEGIEMEGAGQEGRRKGMSRKRRRGDGRKGEKGNKKRTKGRKGAVGRRRSRRKR